MWIVDILVMLSAILSLTVIGERLICLFDFQNQLNIIIWAEEFDVIRDLPDTEENMWKKDIVRKLRLKYVKSNNSGHNNYGHIYFKQVKELKLKFPTYIPWFALFNKSFL